jgi:PST family polysaccharide transporter
MAFARILRSSALLGGAQVVTLGTGFLRAKLIAVLIGPAGVGLVGILTSFNGNLGSLVGWGLGTTAVRTISAADELDRPAKIAAVRKLGNSLTWLGLLAVLLLFWPVGQLTFNSSEYTLELLLAGLAVPFLLATSVWSSLLQSNGQIKSLARVQIISAFGGLILGLPFIWLYGVTGIAASILIAAIVPAIATWKASRNYCSSSSAEADSGDIRTLLQLGSALMAVSFLSQLSAYIVRLMLIRSHGLESAGYYHAAFVIAGSLPGFVFTAMGTDFFPRVAAVKNEAEAQDLCEKQIQAGLLLALPLIAGLLTLGQFCIYLLYSRSFEPAIPLLSWMIWGIFFRLFSWPMGLWLIARGSSRAVVIVTAATNASATLFPVVLLPLFGITGAAIGFFISCISSTAIIIVASRRRSGRWVSVPTLRWFALSAVALGLSQFLVGWLNGPYWGLIPTSILTMLCAWVYYRIMRRENLPNS